MIKLSENTRARVAKAALPEIPAYAELKLGDATEVWTTILYVDMRGSTKRALELGPRATYLTMHGLLPALAYVVNQRNGYIVGFRGDGLFAAFGIDEDGDEILESERKSVLGKTCMTGLLMVEAVQKAVNPVLKDFGVPGDIKIGVGIDAGEVVITRIGLRNAFEITAYGNAVNRSAKLCGMGKNEVLITPEATQLIPSGKGGKLVISAFENGFRISSGTSVLKSMYDMIRG
jgi:class 3 adenylate cyclase